MVSRKKEPSIFVENFFSYLVFFTFHHDQLATWQQLQDILVRTYVCRRKSTEHKRSIHLNPVLPPEIVTFISHIPDLSLGSFNIRDSMLEFRLCPCQTNSHFIVAKCFFSLAEFQENLSKRGNSCITCRVD